MSLVFPEPLLIRLDTVVARALGIGRREAASRIRKASGGRVDVLRVWPSRCLVSRP